VPTPKCEYQTSAFSSHIKTALTPQLADANSQAMNFKP